MFSIIFFQSFLPNHSFGMMQCELFPYARATTVTTRTLCSRKHLRLERTLYILEEIDKIIRFRAVEEDKRFSNIVEDCFRACFDKELKEYKR